jgi:hypothetical protein
MMIFNVKIRARLETATDDQVASLLRRLPHTMFDPMRRELVQTSSVRSGEEAAARKRAARRIRWALDDAGLAPEEYSIAASATVASNDSLEDGSL